MTLFSSIPTKDSQTPEYRNKKSSQTTLEAETGEARSKLKPENIITLHCLFFFFFFEKPIKKTSKTLNERREDNLRLIRQLNVLINYV